MNNKLGFQTGKADDSDEDINIFGKIFYYICVSK